MITPLDEATEAVAIAQREVYVANSLVNEYQNKRRLAEDELNSATDRLYSAKNALAQLALDRHADTQGHLLSDEDRSEFEKRWDAKMDALKAKREFYNEQMAKKEKKTDYLIAEVEAGCMSTDGVRRGLLSIDNPHHPDHPDHVHEDCCK